MKHTLTHLAALLLCLSSAQSGADEPSASMLEKQFRELPMEARRMTGPLFWMHGDETREQLEAELKNVLEGGNGTFTAEPRPHPDWLGDGWYRDLEICLQFARKHDLTTIIYDDWWWPSQMMGGRVPPQYGGKRIVASSVSVDGPATYSAPSYGSSNLIAVVAGRVADGDAIDGTSLVNLTASVDQGRLTWDAPDGKWNVMKFTWRLNGTRGYQKKEISVDGASPECVDWFIQTVYQPHYDRFKSDFGKTITGYFYDEPETQGDWGTAVPKVISARKLDLAKLLVGYKFKLAGEEQAAAYYSYMDAFAEAWGSSMYGGMTKWCRDHNVFSMGHFMEHNDCCFNPMLTAGNVMQLQKYSDMGGIDLVCRQIYPGQRKMGIYQMPKMASSVSHTYNKTDDIAFSEIFGGYNQNLTYPQMKWLADWHQVRGVNFLIPHSFNPRAPYDKDFPPYFNNGGFEPRWPLYRVWADYTSRLSVMLTGGRHICPIALLHIGQSMHVGKAIRPESLTSTIQDALYDCDWLNYDAFENDASLSGNEIKLHKERYQVLIVPPAEVIPYTVLEKAKEFFENGGTVIGYGFLPSMSATLGKTSEDIAALCAAIWNNPPATGTTARNSNGKGGKSFFLSENPTVEELTRVLENEACIPPVLKVLKGDTGGWLHVLHRVKAGMDIFLICNQNHEGAARNFELRAIADGSPEIWDPMRNEISSIASRRTGDSVDFELTLEPNESVLLVFQPKPRLLTARGAMGKTIIPVTVDADIPVERDPELPADRTPALRSPVKSNPFHGRCEITAIPARAVLELDELVPEAAASVTVNGQFAGGFIGKPFRVDVTKHLKVGVNRIDITPFAPRSAQLICD